MKGRGVRVIGDDDLRRVTPDAPAKERFVVIDTVGVTETELIDTLPLHRAPTVALETMLNKLSFGTLSADEASSVASRLACLERRLSPAERSGMEDLAGGAGLGDIARGIVEALDPDRWIAAPGWPSRTRGWLPTHASG